MITSAASPCLDSGRDCDRNENPVRCRPAGNLPSEAGVGPRPLRRVRRPRTPGRAGWRSARFVAWAVLGLLAWSLRAAEVIPPAPPNHFNDFAGAVSPAVAQRLNAELAQFERERSTQLVVAIYPRMQSDSSIDDYTVRAFQAWQVGRKGTNNGAVLFVFTEDRRLRIATGYGLEGALPDALCRRIIANDIVPQLRAGGFDAGLTAGVQAMMAAARGEYQGTGRTVRESQGGGATPRGAVGGMILLLVLGVILRAVFGRRNTLYQRAGRRGVWINPGGWGGSPWGGGGGGGWSGGGGGGGSFSGGGGGTGGGGASGSW